MNRQRPHAWMIVYPSKRQFWPLEPDPADVEIEDIAHHLSLICRYGGGVAGMYSVAEHSVLVGSKAGVYGLLHDAAEAYIGDMIRPLKREPEFAFYREVDDRLQEVIYEALGLPSPDSATRAAVKLADNRVMFNERDQIHHDERDWGATHEPYPDMQIECWNSAYAEFRFLEEWARLRPKRNYGVS